MVTLGPLRAMRAEVFYTSRNQEGCPAPISSRSTSWRRVRARPPADRDQPFRDGLGRVRVGAVALVVGHTPPPDAFAW